MIVLTVIIAATIVMATAQTRQVVSASVRLKATLAGHRKSIIEMAFSPDGETLATGSEDHTIRLWNVGTGETKAVLTFAEKYKLSWLEWSADGLRLAAYGYRGRSNEVEVRIWDARTEELKATFDPGHRSYITDFRWSPDGRVVLTASEDGTVKLWDAETGQLKKTLEHAPFEPNETESIFKSLFTRKKFAEMRNTRGYFDAAGQSVLTLSYNHLPKLWDAASGKFKTTLPLTEEQPDAKIPFYPANALFSPDGRLVVRNDDAGVALLDSTTGEVRHTYGHIGAARAFSPDGRALLVIIGEPTNKFRGREDTLRLYDVATGQVRLTFENVPEEVMQIYWSPDGGHIVVVGRWGTKTRFLDTRTGRVIARLPYSGCTPDTLWGSTGCESFIFSADGRITLKQKQPLKLWSTETGELLATLDATGGDARFSPTDKRMLVTRGKDKKTILVWDVSIQ